MIKVLFLSQWYPHRYDSMEGLFVQKHAEAVSHYCEVKVLFVYSDKNIKHFEIIENQFHNVNEVIVYYPTTKYRFLHKIVKSINYLRAYYKGYKLLTRKNFKPDIVHVNVLTRTGLMAYFLKVFKRIPYVVTEHWSRYLVTRNSYNGCIRKIITQKVVKNASAVLPVSQNLEEAMLAHHLKNSKYIVVNNVVDKFFFEEEKIIPRTKKRILHVSCFDEAAKNIKGILRATYELSKIRQDFELILIGSGIDFDDISDYADKLYFPKGIIHFLGEKTSQEVAYWMQNSDFFVLFSNYETAGVVIAESLVCGKPVLSTKVGAAFDYIYPENGRLIDVGDVDALLREMNYILDHLDNYDKNKIKNEARQEFSYIHIGEIITKIYSQTLSIA